MPGNIVANSVLVNKIQASSVCIDFVMFNLRRGH
jgi:hypothetical protein